MYAPLLALGLAAATPAHELPASPRATSTAPATNPAVTPPAPGDPAEGPTSPASDTATSDPPAPVSDTTTAPTPTSDTAPPETSTTSDTTTTPPATANDTSAPTAPSDANATAPAPPPASKPARPRWWGPDPRPKVSGYGGPALRLSGLNGAFAAFVGLEGGINVLQRLTIGASLQWLLNPVDAGPFARGSATRININYGGLVVDVAYVRGKRVAGTLGGLLGGGGGCVQDPENGRCADRTAFFVGEPRAGLRVVLAPIVRLHLAVGYRLVAARTWTGPMNLGGPMGSITLEFGWF